MKRVIAIVAPLVIIASLIAWRLVEKTKAESALVTQRQTGTGAAPKVTVASAQVRDIANTFEVTGTLEAPRNVKISSKLTGRVEHVGVHEGDQVRKGQVLVRIDASQVEAEVRQAKAALSEAEYRLAQAQATSNVTDVSISTQIRQQAAAVASAEADYDEARRSLEAEVAVAEANVTEAQGRVDSATAAGSNARAGIRAAEANLENARTRYGRISELYKQGFIAAQDVDDAKTAVSAQEAALDVANGQLQAALASHDSAVAERTATQRQVEIVRNKGAAEVEAARQKVAQAEASLDYAKANTAQSPAYQRSLAALQAAVEVARASVDSARTKVADTVLRSPLDGSITGRYMDPGSVATAGQPILAVQFFRDVWVSVAVPDTVSAKIRLGQELQVTFDSLPARTFMASVIQVNPAADPQARQYTVRAALANPQRLFRPGMFAHVRIVTEKAIGVVAVPHEAVQEDEAGTYVMTVDAQSQAHRQPVSTGMADDSLIAVTRGLRPGEKVITITSVPIRDGQEVDAGGDRRGPRQPGGRPAGAPPGRPVSPP